MKDVTSTSFGLIIAYLLPGLTGLYSLSFWFPRVEDLFSKFGKAESGVGLFLLVLLAAIITGLQISVIRYLIFECCVCRSHKLDPPDLANLANKDKHIAFRTVIDEQYRYHQFWAGMCIVQPAFFYGWITTSTAVTIGSNSFLALLFVSYVVELATFFAAAEAWKRYVARAKHVLTGDPNAERIPSLPSKENDQESSQKSSYQENSQKGSSQEKASQKTPEIANLEEDDDEE